MLNIFSYEISPAYFWSISKIVYLLQFLSIKYLLPVYKFLIVTYSADWFFGVFC